MGLNGRIASLSHTTTQSSAHALTPPPITLVSALMAGIVKGACHIIGSLPATIATAGPWLRKGRISKALLIGINYSHVHQEGWKLGGPHLEVMVFRDLLIRHYGVPADNIVVMIDAENVSAQLQPTSENIKRELQRFHNPYERGDYFFLYCGHADQKVCVGSALGDEGYEEDGKDEYILPCDSVYSDGTIDDAKLIQDKYLRKCLVDPTFPGSQLLAVIDSCHSNTLLNLKHSRCNRVHSSRSRGRRITRRALELVDETVGDSNNPVSGTSINKRLSSINEAFKHLWNPKHIQKLCNGYCSRLKFSGLSFLHIESRVICISACKDSEESYEDGRGVSLAKMIVDVLKVDPNPILEDFMRAVDAEIKSHYSSRRRLFPAKQSPQL